MKAVVVMFDSLNRHMLPPYGCDDVHAPNFSRLARRSVTFDTSYVCSMPCMPARRDFHTGRPHFLHRDWGPLEPFDDSVPQMLRDAGVYTHLVTDHYHYFEDGGGTYHNRYSSWEAFRGQEFDRWAGKVRPCERPESIGATKFAGENMERHFANLERMRNEEDMPQAKTFRAGIDFLRENAGADNWLLHLETFDPHEPFNSHRKYEDLYPEDYDGPEFYWPVYREVTESHDQVEHCRREYKALLSMCDASLGNVLDTFDELDLWDDTMLIVWTDHGFLLSEHELWAKCHIPWYEETAHTPFFVWDPRAKIAGERRAALVQPSIDLGPTLLEFFGLEPTPDMQGRPLAPVIADDTPIRDAGLFGIYGGQVNVTDGRYVYMRATADADAPIYEYTFMPTQMTRMFPLEPLRSTEIAEPFSFMKGCRPMRLRTRGKITAPPGSAAARTLETRLYDLKSDPCQKTPIDDPAIEARMTSLLVEQMRLNDAPKEQFVRLGLPIPK